MDKLTVQDYSGVYGEVTNPYQQTYPDTCAIKSQQLILNDFGIAVTEDQLVEYSARQGWYSGEGTQMQDVGKLLADAGIPCTQTVDANVYDLANELAQGHKVIIAVDSGELWDNGILDWLKDIFIGDTPDHALIVSGIDMSDPNNPMVVLTDPGTGQAAQPYPLDQFMDAWGDSQNFMVSTNLPTPLAKEQFVQNDMSEMHLPEVAGVDYGTFQNFQAYSHLIEPTLLPDLNMAFQTYPTLPTCEFNMAMMNMGLPYYDMNMLQLLPMPYYDPYTFDYQSLCDPSWINYAPADYYDSTAHSYEVLNDLHQDALDYAQQCMDDGMYIQAQMWQHEAHNIQDQIDDL